MKRLEHGKAKMHADCPSSNAVSRRRFFKLGAAGVLAAKLALGGFGASFFLPTTANAQVLHIRGIKVFTMRLSDTVDNLDKKTSQYRKGQYNLKNGVYTTVLEVQDEKLSAVVLLEPNNGRSGFSVNIPPEKHKNPMRGLPVGTLGVIISDFIDMVEAETGQEVAGIKWIVDNRKKAINVFVLPVNSDGEIIGKHKGGYLAVGMTYNLEKGTLYGGRSLLLEPGIPEPVASR